MFINTKKQGDWGLGAAINYFAENGFNISVPLTDSQDYDLVIEVNGQLKKVQIKTSTYKRKESTNYYVSVSVKGGNRSGSSLKKFDNTLVDYIFVITGDSERYFIPSEIIGTSGFTLNQNFDIFKK